MIGNISVDNKASVVTSSISRVADLTWLFEGAHKDRMCVGVFIVASVRPCRRASVWVLQKNFKPLGLGLQR